MPAPCIPRSLPLTLNWDSLIPLIGQANRAIAQYDGILYGLRNPAALLSPLTTQEAVLSSRIEGTQATLGEVLKFQAGEEIVGEARRQDIHEIINYRKALRVAETELHKKPFNLNLLLQLHAILLDSVRGRDKSPGRFRTDQNWVGEPGCKIEKARFVPPEPQHVLPALDNWEKYYHADEPDVLVQLAILHAQFEVIHPFRDGNGRLGRIVIPLFLYERKVLSRPMFYLSTYLEANRDEYIARLRNLGPDGSWEPWIAFFLGALIEQANTNVGTARAIIALYEKLKQKILDLTRSQFAVPLTDRLFEQPIFSTSDLIARKGMPSKPMLMFMLNKLKAAGILKVLREGSGRRAQVLALPSLINLCEGKKVI